MYTIASRTLNVFRSTKGILIISYSRKLTIFALLIISLLGGALVWLFAKSNTIHTGSSGIIFALIGFLIFIGVFRRAWIASVSLLSADLSTLRIISL